MKSQNINKSVSTGEWISLQGSKVREADDTEKMSVLVEWCGVCDLNLNALLCLFLFLFDLVECFETKDG